MIELAVFKIDTNHSYINVYCSAVNDFCSENCEESSNSYFVNHYTMSEESMVLLAMMYPNYKLVTV